MKRTLVVLVVALTSARAWALRDPLAQGLALRADFDVRDLVTAADAPARAARTLTGLAAWSEQLGGELQYALDPRSGLPRTVFSWRGAIGRLEPGVDPVESARAFLAARPEVFGLDAADLAGLVDAGTYDHRTGFRVIKLLQAAGGVELLADPIKLYVEADGRVIRVNLGDYLPGLAGSRQPLRPALTAAEAVAIAAAAIGAPWPIGDGPEPAEASPLARPGRQVFARGPLAEEAWAELRIFPAADGPRLAWEVWTASPDAPALYRQAIDATDGRLLQRENRTRYASARVFALPTAHPCSDGDCFNDDRVVSSLDRRPATAPAAYTATWIDPPPNAVLSSNSTVTRQDAGRGAFLCQDGTRTDAQARPAQDFDYPLDLGSDPFDGPGLGRNTDVAIANLHWLNNYIHDFFYDLGFTEAALNFQRDNFGLGGAGNDPVIGDVQDGRDGCQPATSTNNANFATQPDGTSGRMQMYLWTLTTPRRDGDLDADIPIHEFCHGLSIRTVGSMNGAQAGAMGEGWGDIYASSITDDDRVGEYASGMADGIRHYPYDVSPLTMLDFGNVGGSGRCEVHDDGEVWATTMWRFRQDFLAIYPDALQKFHQMMYDSLVLSPSGPTFTQARDSIVQSGIRLGINECQLWQLLARQGLAYRSNATLLTLGSNSCTRLNDNDRRGQPIDGNTAGFFPRPGCECPSSFQSSPTIQTIDGSGGTTVDLSWTAVADNPPSYTIAAYEVFRSADCAGSFARVGFTPAGTLSFQDSTVASGQGYAYRVRAITPFGSACGTDGACRTVTTGSCAGAPDVVPGSLRAAADAANALHFAWQSGGTGTWNLHQAPWASKAGLPTLHTTPRLASSTTLRADDPGGWPEGYYGVYGADCAGNSVP